ncbi:hypothetical protein NCC49_005501 [Naganishia albida]|nr:hypothetical protein NCC49_005501 [Naganishia albida]
MKKQPRSKQPKSFVQRYKLDNGGTIDNIPADETGICECPRYCEGGKIVNGATFRRHYLKSKQDANKNDPPHETPRAAVLDTGPSPLCESLAKIPEPSIPILLAWFQEHDIWIHESLEIREMSDGGGIAVFAVGAGAPQQVVCKIPRSAILSVHTVPLVALLPPKTASQIPAIVLLALSLLYELRLGPESLFWGYLQSLPRRCVPIVALWGVVGGEEGKRARDLCYGTAIEDELKRIKKDGHGMEDLSLYHRATLDFFPATTFSPAPPTFLDLLYAYSLVSSRAFQVDVYHGAALVPLADVFNHQEINNVCFESDDFVCEECGSLPTCEHDEIEGIEPRYESAKVPSTTSPETIAIAGRLSHLPLEIIRSLFDPAQNTLDLTVKTPFVSGQEVFNTYGEGMGWAKQAVEWGFVDVSIEGDGALGRGLRWDLGDVLDQDSEDYGRAKKAWKKLCEARHENDQQDPQAEIGTDSTGNQDLETDSLFFAPPSNAPAKDNLLLNEDGQISYPLYWALVCGLHPALKDSSTAPNKVDILARRAQRSVDGRTDVSDGEAGEAVIGRLARHVVALFERRIARTSHPIKTAAELCDMLDEASPSSSTLFLLDSF